MPWSIGWTKYKMPHGPSSIGGPINNGTVLAPSLDRLHRSTLETRFQRHVLQTRCTRDALRNIVTAKDSSSLSGAVFLALAHVVQRLHLRRLCVAATVLSGLLWLGFSALEQRFYVSYDRKKDLATNKI